MNAVGGMQEAIMAGDIAMAAVVAFAAGIMFGMVVTIVVAIRQDRGRDSIAGQSLDLLERKARRILSSGFRHPAAHPDSR
jgi:hypothetical protein